MPVPEGERRRLCFDSAAERVEAVVADVQSIPWGERHHQVLAHRARRGSGAEGRARPHRPRRRDEPRRPAWPDRGRRRRPAPRLRPGRRRPARHRHRPRPARLARTAARQRRPRRGLRRRALGDRRPRRPDQDRRPRATRPRRPARSDRPAARSPAPPAPPGSGEHPAWRPRQHLRPLRPRQRPLRFLPGRTDDLQTAPTSRAKAPASRRRSSPSSIGSADGCGSGPTTTCWRSAPVGAGSPSTPPASTAAG